MRGGGKMEGRWGAVRLRRVRREERKRRWKKIGVNIHGRDVKRFVQHLRPK